MRGGTCIHNVWVTFPTDEPALIPSVRVALAAQTIHLIQFTAATVQLSGGTMRRAWPAIEPPSVRIPAGAVRAWDRQRYPEERPVRGVTVDGLWIHRIPVTSRQFKALATGHITEILLGKYPGASPHMLYTFRDCLNNFNKILTLRAFVSACFFVAASTKLI